MLDQLLSICSNVTHEQLSNIKAHNYTYMALHCCPTFNPYRALTHSCVKTCQFSFTAVFRPCGLHRS